MANGKVLKKVKQDITKKTNIMLPDLFETPIRSKRVRHNVYAYQYRNGTININGTKYLEYTMAEAIKLWRTNNPLKN